MLQLTPHLRILVALEPVDFRNGIGGLVRCCQAALGEDPFRGTVFAFRNRRATAVKTLAYDGQGFWLCQKRLSMGKFRWWPARKGERAQPLAAHELQVLLSAGDPMGTQAAPPWRPVGPAS